MREVWDICEAGEVFKILKRIVAMLVQRTKPGNRTVMGTNLQRVPFVYFVFITKTHSPRLFKLIKMSYIGNNELFNQL